MKIIELALLHKGFLDNREFFRDYKNTNKTPPHPECTTPYDRISYIKVDVGGLLVYARIHTSGMMETWGLDEEYFKHYVYLNLMDDVMSTIRAELNKQANKILGDKVECI